MKKYSILFVSLILYYQLFAQDFKINENIGPHGSDKSNPSISMSLEGEFILTWIDFRNGGKDIYAQRFSKLGIRLGENILVNENFDKVFNDGPSVTFLNENNDFAISWTEFQNTVYTQIFNWSGDKIGQNFVANQTYPTWSNCNSVEIASNLDDNFMVVWYEGYLKTRLFNNIGEPQTDEIKVNASTKIGSSGSGRIVASNYSGSYAVVWSGYYEGEIKTNIYLQVFDKRGLPIGENILISDSTDASYKYFPSVSGSENGNFVVVWEEWLKHASAENTFVSAQIYSIQDGKIGNNINVNERDEIKWSNFTSVSCDKEGNFVVSWRDRSFLKARSFTSLGSSLGDEFSIIRNHPNAYQYFSSMDSDSEGNYTLVWQDPRHGNTSIYSQRYSSDNKPMGGNFKPHVDVNSSWENNPSIAVQKDGDYIVVWEDRRSGFSDIYSQLFSKDNTPIGANQKVSTRINREHCNEPIVGIDYLGDFIVAWQLGEHNIYLQKVSKSGSLIGENVGLNTPSIYGMSNLKLTFNSSTHVLVSWMGRNRDMKIDLYAQKISQHLVFLGDIINLNSQDISSSFPYLRSYSINNDWDVCYSWSNYYYDTRMYENEIYTKIISSNGDVITEGVSINEEDSKLLKLSVNSDQINNFCVSWISEQSRNNYGLFVQKIPSDGYPNINNVQIVDSINSPPYLFKSYKDDEEGILYVWGNDYNLTAQLSNTSLQKIGNRINLFSHPNEHSNNYSFYFKDGLLYSTWEDNRTAGTGTDIWMNISTLFDHLNTDPISISKLYQNYPNPFNSKTRIYYTIENDSHVNLSVYNALGQKVDELENGNKLAGIHYANFNSSSHSSGIYYYRIITNDDTQTKKMIILK